MGPQPDCLAGSAPQRPTPEGTLKNPFDEGAAYADREGNLYDESGSLVQRADQARVEPGKADFDADTPDHARVETPARQPVLVGAGARVGDELGDVGRAADGAQGGGAVNPAPGGGSTMACRATACPAVTPATDCPVGEQRRPAQVLRTTKTCPAATQPTMALPAAPGTPRHRAPAALTAQPARGTTRPLRLAIVLLRPSPYRVLASCVRGRIHTALLVHSPWSRSKTSKFTVPMKNQAISITTTGKMALAKTWRPTTRAGSLHRNSPDFRKIPPGSAPRMRQHRPLPTT